MTIIIKALIDNRRPTLWMNSQQRLILIFILTPLKDLKEQLLVVLHGTYVHITLMLITDPDRFLNVKFVQKVVTSANSEDLKLLRQLTSFLLLTSLLPKEITLTPSDVHLVSEVTNYHMTLHGSKMRISVIWTY